MKNYKLTKAISSSMLIGAVLLSGRMLTFANGLTQTASIEASFEQLDTLELILSDNIIDFGQVNGLVDVESTTPITATVSSSLPWDMTIQAITDFIGENDATNTLGAENLQIKVDNEEYVSLSKDEIKIIDNALDGSDLVYNLSFKLKAVTGLKADTYKIPTVVKIVQK